jgi:S-adenosylmethionine/arginine decarboxylase-like enzyme
MCANTCVRSVTVWSDRRHRFLATAGCYATVVTRAYRFAAFLRGPLRGFLRSRVINTLSLFMTQLVHKHVIIRAEVLDPPTIEKLASEQVKDLIDRIGMRLLMGPYAKYVTMLGNRGLTVAAIIETSHIVMHTWDERDPALVQLDVYTCGPFEPQTVFAWLQQYKPIKMDYKYIDRELGLEELTINMQESQPCPAKY